VPVLEVGEEGSNCFLVSAYCPGENLGEWMAKQADPIPLPTAAAIVAALADAVEFSHARGVLHRDLKPANVMLDPRVAGPADGGEELLPFVPRLTDFGLAKVVEAGLTETRTSVVLGTPVYMSPEQADGISQVGPPADIYSLGVILYELITRRVPFHGSLATVLEQVREAPPTAPSRLRWGLPTDLETICLKCLHKQPRHRYRTAEELAEDLRRFLDGRPIKGRRLTILQKFTNWARHPNRLRDAGAYGIALNAAFLIWMPTNATLAAIDVRNLAAFPEQVEAIRTLAGILGTIAIAASIHAPMLVISWQTMRGKRWAIRGGIIVSLITLSVAIAAWTRLIVPFGGFYADPRLRTTIYSLLVPLFAAQLAGFLTAKAAVRRLKS
jgi:serine/threonine protein kinase